MTPLFRSFVVALLVVFGAGCNKQQTPAAGGTTAAKSAQGDLAPDTVVATVKDKKITAGELDKELEAEMSELEDQFK